MHGRLSSAHALPCPWQFKHGAAPSPPCMPGCRAHRRRSNRFPHRLAGLTQLGQKTRRLCAAGARRAWQWDAAVRGHSGRAALQAARRAARLCVRLGATGCAVLGGLAHPPARPLRAGKPLTSAVWASVRTRVYASLDTNVLAFVGTSVFSTDSGLSEQPSVPARAPGGGAAAVRVRGGSGRGGALRLFRRPAMRAGSPLTKVVTATHVLVRR